MNITQYSRWHRDEKGTYENRWNGKKSFQVKIANHGVHFIRTIFKLHPRETEIWCLLRFSCKSNPIDVLVKLESLADEKAFSLIAPLGFSFTAVPKAFSLFHECLMDDVATAEREAVVTELGWMLWDGQPVYADASGIIRSDPSLPDPSWKDAIGTAQRLNLKDINAACADVPILADNTKGLDFLSVEQSQQLNRYRLKPAKSQRHTKEAIRRFLEMLHLGDPNVLYPAFFSVIAALIQDPRFVVFLYGPTGNLKTELGKLMLSLFIPGARESDCVSFNSTSVALQARLTCSGNVAVLIDDYVQHSKSGKGSVEAKRADDIIRAMGNGASRDRCFGDGNLRPRDEPRGLCIFTGEQMPDGLDSMRSRTICLSVDAETFREATEGPRPNRLDYFQKLAANGIFSEMTHAFVTWLAPRLSTCRETLKDQFLFDNEPPVHRRVLDATNVILSAANIFLNFAIQQNACTEAEADDHYNACSEALLEHVRRVHLESLDDKATTAFGAHITNAMLSGKAHLEIEDIEEYLEMDPPVPIENLGYTAQKIPVHKVESESCSSTERESYKTVYVPKGIKIGRLRNNEIIDLFPDVCLTVANSLAIGSNSSPMPSPKVFGRLLREDGWIAGCRKDGNTQKARFGGVQISVWRIHLFRLFELVLDWGQFDVATYASMSEAERQTECHKRRERNQRALRDRISASQIESVLNPLLSPEDKEALLKPTPPLGDYPSGNRRFPVASPQGPDLPGYGAPPKDDLLA
ncbi:hypothetical protein [Rosistilla oblonga]|uniref:hypothetical protein n=1 Tax=Rosistilla oblonga TaxID=2527990 RepID=UPI003A97D2C4